MWEHYYSSTYFWYMASSLAGGTEAISIYRSTNLLNKKRESVRTKTKSYHFSDFHRLTAIQCLYISSFDFGISPIQSHPTQCSHIVWFGLSKFSWLIYAIKENGFISFCYLFSVCHFDFGWTSSRIPTLYLTFTSQILSTLACQLSLRRSWTPAPPLIIGWVSL